MHTQQHIQYLLGRYLERTATTAERKELFVLLSQNRDDALWESILETRALQEPKVEYLKKEDWEDIIQMIIGQEKKTTQITSTRKYWPYKRWYQLAAAAILILAIGSGIYYFSNQSYKSDKSPQITVQTKEHQEIPPGTNKAILTLSNGTQKELTLADNGLQLQSDAVLLTTPRGGQYQAVLPDGSKVWLNAASSIQFPSTFTNKERKVEITGEVYFEIAKDASRPFKVSGGGQEIEVLGTSFNINVYDDEPASKTTLITGAIKVNNQHLQPGEAYSNGNIIQTNINEDIAWTTGLFKFNKSSIQTIMRQLARWYDLEITYKGTINEKFITTIPRNVPVSQVLEMLELTGGVHFIRDGNKITVQP